MATIRELVTVLRYRVDKSGLNQYKTQAVAAARQVKSAIRTASAAGKGGFQGLFLGIRDAVREQRTFIRDQAELLKKSREASKQYSALAGYIRAAFAGVGLASFTNAADSVAGSEAQIDLFAQNPGNKKQIRDQIFNNAQAAGSDYIAGLDMFGSIARNRSTLGLSDQDAIKLADLTGKAVALTSKGAAQDSAAILQFSQALGAGLLQGDELSSILENSGGLALAIADAFGVSVTQLKQMGKEGKLTSKEMAQGLLKQASNIDDRFAKIPKTFGKGFTLIRNAFLKLSRDINESTGAAEGFFKVSQLIADNLSGIAKTLAILGASWALMRMKAALMGGLQGVTMLGAALIRLRALGMGALFPFLKMAAVLGSIYLIGEDISVWLKGGKSLIGNLIGPASEWSGPIQTIKDTLTSIKNSLGGASQTLGQWVVKWGTISTVVAGLYLILKPIGLLIWNIATVIIPMMWKAFAMTPLGRILSLIGLVAAAVWWIYENWDLVKLKIAEGWDWIKNKVNGIWDSVIKYFTDKWTSAINAVKEAMAFLNPFENTEGGLIPTVAEGGKRNLRIQEARNRRRAGNSLGPDITFHQTNHITTNGSPEATGNAVGHATGRALEKGSGSFGTVEAAP